MCNLLSSNNLNIFVFMFKGLQVTITEQNKWEIYVYLIKFKSDILS